MNIFRDRLGNRKDHLQYEKQTEHDINTRAKNYSYGGLGFEDVVRYTVRYKTFEASIDT